MILLLHGNPGSGDDLRGLTQALEAEGLAIAGAPTRPLEGAPLEALYESIDAAIAPGAGASEAVLLGFSWGAYLAMAYARARSVKPKALVLVNPYLVCQKPMSPLVRGLLAVPGLGSFLLGRSLGKTLEGYLDAMFQPHGAPPAHAEPLRERLGSVPVWRGAIAYKQLQASAPLAAGELPCPVLVVRGIADAVGEWAVQSAPLGAAGATKQVDVDAGHCLPFTHATEVAAHVAEFLGALAR